MRFRWIFAAILTLVSAFALLLFFQQNRDALVAPLGFGRLSVPLLQIWVLSLLTAVAAIAALMGWRLMRQKKTQKGLRAAAQTQKDRAGSIQQAEHLFHHHRFVQCLAELDRLDGKSPRLAELRFRALHGKGDVEDAFRFLKSAFEQHQTPNLAYPWIEYLLDQSEFERALSAITQLQQQDPQSVRARQLKLDVLQRLERWAECLETLAPLEGTRPDLYRQRHPGYRFEYLRKRLEQEGPSRNFFNDIQAAVTQYPDFVPFYTLWAEGWMAKHEPKKAFDIYERAYRQTHHPIFLALIESYYLEHERPEDAIQIYRQLLVRDGGETIAYHLGRLYQKLEMMDDALKICEPLGEKSAGSASVAIHLSDILARLDRHDEAYQMIRKFLDHYSPLANDYQCGVCGVRQPQWSPQCADCDAWNSINLEFAPQVRELHGSAPIYY